MQHILKVFLVAAIGLVVSGCQPAAVEDQGNSKGPGVNETELDTESWESENNTSTEGEPE